MEPWLLPSPDEDGSEPEEADERDDGMVEESLDDEDSPERHAPIHVGVLPGNVRVVEVFRRCQPQISVGLGVWWQGVSAGEIKAACDLWHVPHAEWPRVLEGVQLMATVVANARNDEAAKRNPA